ncbi:MAG: NTP transferase domain-containing protein [Nitrosomonadales bacterium]|nr:NTP transferase domain-containing protein [Nitrosomonadales bacterium]
MSTHRQRPILAALILAAGYSSRMDRFKPLMRLDGRTVIEAAVDTFRNAGIGRIAVVTGHEAERLEPVLKYMGIPAVRNPDFARGMYSSMQAGIKSLSGDVDACFLLPADVPLVRPATVKAMAERHESSHPSIVYPVFDGRPGHPTLIARRLFGEILAEDGAGELGALLQRHQAESSKVHVFDEGVLLDMDTPEDYERLAKLAPRRHVPTAAECDAILAALAVDDPIRRHGHAVAAVAEAMTKRLNAHGVIIDPDLVRAASLLHDIAKGDPVHAESGAAIVTSLGFPEVGDVIGQHMDMDYDGCSPREAAIVFLADKLVREDRRIDLEEYYRHGLERFHNQPETLRGLTGQYDTALAILAAVERLAGESVTNILADCGVPTCP